MSSYSCPCTPGTASSRGSGADMEKLPMLRVSHCQTALFGKRGGGSGGGGLTAGTSSREERSEAAEMRETTSQACLPGQKGGGQWVTDRQTQHQTLQHAGRTQEGERHVFSSCLHNTLIHYSFFSGKCRVQYALSDHCTTLYSAGQVKYTTSALYMRLKTLCFSAWCVEEWTHTHTWYRGVCRVAPGIVFTHKRPSFKRARHWVQKDFKKSIWWHGS